MDMSLPAETSRQVILKELSERHKSVAALLAQGLSREVVAAATDYSPEYVTWLGNDPLFVEYVRKMSALAGVQLEALFVKSVDVIAENMVNGTSEDKLRAARLQMEATGRIGKNLREGSDGDGGADRLLVLAERLVALGRSQGARIIEGSSTFVPEAVE